MSERTDNRWLRIASRAADFIFGGLMILIGGGLLVGFTHKVGWDNPWGNIGDIITVLVIAGIPLVFGVRLIIRKRVNPPTATPDAEPGPN